MPRGNPTLSGAVAVTARPARPAEDLESCMIRHLFGEQRPLPTPRATDGTKGGPNQRGSSGDLMLPSAVMRMMPTPTATPYGSNQSPTPGAAVRSSLDSIAPTLLPTPTSSSPGSTANFQPDGTPYGDGYGPTLLDAIRMMPTPRAKDATGGVYPLTRPESQDNLETRIIRLFKTPTAQLAVNGGSQDPDKRRAGGHGPTLADEVEHHRGPDWGVYTSAVRRWELVLGRAAPCPTAPGRTGPRLSPRFPEWMMGLADGWVTAVPSIPRTHQLKAIGNGVVPQQGAEALRRLVARMEGEQGR
jgi:hypothetical protein